MMAPKLCIRVHAHRQLFKRALISEMPQRKSIAERVFPLRSNILESTNRQESSDFERQGTRQQLA